MAAGRDDDGSSSSREISCMRSTRRLGTPESGLVTRLPPSPPQPSADLDNEDDTEPRDDESPERVLGVVDLIAMARGKRKPRPMTRSIELLGGLDDGPEAQDDGRGGPSSARQEAGQDGDSRPSLDISRTSSGPFAKDVVITGWTVVGGKGWGEAIGVGSYVVYDIQVTLQSGARITIHRRYNDFVALRQALDAAFPHLQQTIPPLPGKKHMHKFAPAFVAERQPRLQRFLRTVMLHPEMGRAGESSVIGRWVTSKDLG